jgi:hypothetical protein
LCQLIGSPLAEGRPTLALGMCVPGGIRGRAMLGEGKQPRQAESVLQMVL